MSLSRDFAAFVANLRHDDLPAEVIDRAKGVTLQALISALLAHAMPASRQALDRDEGDVGLPDFAGVIGEALVAGFGDHPPETAILAEGAEQSKDAPAHPIGMTSHVLLHKASADELVGLAVIRQRK